MHAAGLLSTSATEKRCGRLKSFAAADGVNGVVSASDLVQGIQWRSESVPTPSWGYAHDSDQRERPMENSICAGHLQG